MLRGITPHGNVPDGSRVAAHMPSMTTIHKNQVGQPSKNGGEFAARTHSDADVELGNPNRELIMSGTIIVNRKSKHAYEATVRNISESGEFCITVEGEKTHARYRVVHVPSGLAVPAQVHDYEQGIPVTYAASGYEYERLGHFRRITDARNYMKTIDTPDIRTGLDDDGIRKIRSGEPSFKDTLLEHIKTMGQGAG